MSKRTRNTNSASLIQHFEASTGYVGGFGWVCGYSADADFLDMAAERFTALARGQRAHAGQIALAVMLDPGNPRIAPIDAPGVAHLPIRTFKEKPFKLLHAKVALLGFRDPREPARWLVRLVVSTGNWTRQTLEDSLDLAWRIEVTSEALDAKDWQTQGACSDIHAARELLMYLADLFDDRLLSVNVNGHPGDTALARQQLDGWLDQISGSKKGKSRFFDNRKDSLLAQLPKMIENAGVSAACNYLAMGSGFYETERAGNAVPKVLSKIVATLKKERLTASCEVDIFVNPLGCQAVAQSVKALTEDGFKVRPAQAPENVFPDGRDRSLHAKFLFGANYRKGSNNCTSTWIYLGSGNLTGPGFDAKASVDRGNLEAGVVFAPDGLCWYQETDITPAKVVTNLLPMQWQDHYDDENILTAGGDMPVRPDAWIAAPVAWLTWGEMIDPAQAGGRLCLPEPLQPAIAFEVLDDAGKACVVVAGDFLWQGGRPRQVAVRWIETDGTRHEGLLPVLDEFGRVAATGLSSLDLDEVAWQLAQFPATPDDEGVDQDGSPEDPPTSGKPPPAKALRMRGDYAIRQMMELVENVATRQTAVGEADWFAWCNRLEQTLMRARDSIGVQTFIGLEINPLSPLRAMPFRPTFAEADESDAGKRYLDALQRIEAAWNVKGLKAIGEAR